MINMKVGKKGVARLIIVVTLLLCVFLSWNLFFARITADSRENLYVSRGDSSKEVMKSLEPHVNFVQKGFLIAFFEVLGIRLRSGCYNLRGETVLSLCRNIRNGHQKAVKLVLPSVRTKEDLARFLSESLWMDSSSVICSMNDTNFCATFGYTPETILLLFVPNTYDVYWNTSVSHFFEKMAQERASFWNESRLQKAKEIALSTDEVMILASIVDEETANNAEKPMIAGMYLNRLRKGMPLQADPTIKFAWKNFSLRRIYHKLLTIDSPYNTYKREGLPPGPIRIPSVAGIDAVLNSIKHDYLYMCAKEDLSGTHNFSVTYGEHLKNASAYAKALDKRRIE